MYRGTTPTIKFHINSDIDLNAMSQIWVTFKSQTQEVTKEIGDIKVDNENKVIFVKLTQKESLTFSNDKVYTQIRFLTFDDVAYASNIQQLVLKNVLKEGVIYASQ